MAATKEKCLAKPDDRLKKTDFREKLRSMPSLKKNETERKRGPLIAKPTLLFTQTNSSVTQHTNEISYRGSRTPSPPRSSESAFTRQVVHNYRSFSPGPPARRTRSPSYTRSSSPSSPSASRRTPSPTGFDAAFQEEIKKRVQKVLRARLYLLQQIGPNSFMIGGDSPMHKFRVIIGPQSCSCGHGPHCVHLLFVMLRVFQVSESDTRLWNRTLKNYEVESLFKNYHARRNIRMKNSNNFKVIKHHSSASSNPTESSDCKSEMNNKDDEEICPICLLEMLDGESLVSCEVGCHNKLHHHCIAIWAEECRRQKEPIICPLCRAEWGKQKESNRDSNRQHSSSSCRMQRSSESILGENDIILPHSEPIPREYLTVALPWTQIFGEEVVSCLFSRDWMSREIALRYLSKEIIKSLALVSHNGPVSSLQETRAREALCNCCNILAYMAGDPVYKVFIASLKCLRTMLAYVPCQNEQDLSSLQDNLRPFVKTILLKCADSNRRTSQLSISTLMELCRGQRGELAIGRETRCAWQDGIGGVGYLLNCIIENYNSDSISWQWLLGRLCAIDKLMEEFPRDFCLLYIKGRQSNSSQVHINDTDNLVNYERLVSLINFSVGAISNQHTTVSKMAKHVFLLVARRATHIPSVFNEFCDKLQVLEPGIQHRLHRRLRTIAQEFQAATSTPTSNRTAMFNDELEWVQSKDNKKLINKLNSSEFFYDHVSKGFKDFKVNNLKSSHNLLTPPPTPEHRFQRSLSVPTISSFHSQNREKLEEIDLIDFSEPSEKHKSNLYFGNLEKTCFTNKTPILKEEKLVPPSSLNVSLNFMETSLSDDFSDLADITMSKFSDVQLITFKSEVTTPKSSPTRQPSRALLHLCKEELEEEEAIALAIAMETSAQEALPHIPGLSSDNSDEVITIHLQPEMGEKDYHPHVYLENVHWIRGPLLGTGAFSSCYQVRDVKSGTLMAVKQVSFCRNSSDEQQRVTQAIKEEIVMMAKLNHPNVLRIMGATQQGGHFNMFVEWMPGGSVAGLLDKYGTFAESVIINYTQQVLRGLAYLHDNHILHRDLKGANLLVDSTGQHLRIGDFGAAARLASHATGAGEFQGQLLGTIAFMAPEVLRGEDYGRNCDIWSVGCVMIEMATAKPPWNAHDLSNHLALIFKIACSTGPPSIPDHLSPGARDLALRCLEQNSEDRPPAKELLKHPVFRMTVT